MLTEYICTEGPVTVYELSHLRELFPLENVASADKVVLEKEPCFELTTEPFTYILYVVFISLINLYLSAFASDFTVTFTDAGILNDGEFMLGDCEIPSSFTLSEFQLTVLCTEFPFLLQE